MHVLDQQQDRYSKSDQEGNSPVSLADQTELQ